MKTMFLLMMIKNPMSVFFSPEQKAIDNITNASFGKKTKQNIEKYAPLVVEISNHFNINYKRVLSVAWTESHFNPKARSWVNAQGIMQVMPATYNEFYKKVPEEEMKRLITLNLKYGYKTTANIIVGTYYLKHLLSKFNNNWKLTTVAYNMGPNWVRRRVSKNQEVGVKNKYLDKVSNILKIIKKEEIKLLVMHRI